MQNFTFYNPTKILFGKGQIASITQEIPLRISAVLITYGGGSIKQNGVYAEVHGGTWLDIRYLSSPASNRIPTYETLMEAVRVPVPRTTD
jgi:NADP-dependent alcohol dehydrogenase